MKYTLTRAVQILASVAILLVCATSESSAAKTTTYTLLGFNLTGIHGVDQKALEAKLKHKPGDRITRADIADDTAIVERELKAQHIAGHLFATLAEKKGRVWVIIDLLNSHPAPFGMHRQLEAQHFEGATRVSADALSEASGLRPGDVLSPDKLNAARKGIVAAYAKALPGKQVQITGKMQGEANGNAVLTWTIHEPQ